MFLDLPLKREAVYLMYERTFILYVKNDTPLFIACEVNNLRLVE